MQIDFFEELPTSESLAPARHLAPPARIYLAAPDLSAFQRRAASLRRVAPDLEPAYWPLLPRSYWISPFAAGDELERLRQELGRAEPLAVLLDLELPLLRPARLLRGLPGFARRRAGLHRLLEDAHARGHRVVTAEYPALGPVLARGLERLGISPPLSLPHTRLPMAYSSLIPTRALRRRVREAVAEQARRHPGRIDVGLGAIAAGALGREPILSPDALDRDLAFFGARGVARAAIFRLGGLTPPYLEVVRAHAAR